VRELTWGGSESLASIGSRSVIASMSRAGVEGAVRGSEIGMAD
jgi:hypothetical protein